jgi:mRNA interferase YafQ
MERWMREIFRQNQFKKDVKKIKKSGRCRLRDLFEVVEVLAKDRQLQPKNCDHSLTGDWKDFRECHILPDWLIIYRLEPGKLILVRTGSHSELFG